VRAALVVLIVLTTTTRAETPRWLTCPLPPAMPEPAAHGAVAVDGAEIYYAVFGKGAPVILLHGGLGNSDHWSNQVPALAEHYEVIAIDSRGQGRSTRTRAPVTYEKMANDVLAVMDKLEVPRAQDRHRAPRSRRSSVRVRHQLRFQRLQAAWQP
jgi:hypothetical protein